MCIIPQKNLFAWEEVERKSDLERLCLVLEVLPDERLMRLLEAHRGQGRNDYPVRQTWNTLIAAIVYQHKSIESLRRELERNGDLLKVCGFPPGSGPAAVPTARAYSEFLKNLLCYQDEIDAMLDQLIEDIRKFLPDLGEHLAIDSKGIPSAGKPTRNKNPDGRRDNDADWGTKTYRGIGKDGKPWEKVIKWFGYKLHLIVDSLHELPLAYEVTKASPNDCPFLLPMMEKLKGKHPGLVKRSGCLSGDKGYDSARNNRKLYQDYQIKPLIDTRQMWKNGDKTRLLFPDRADNIVYDERGKVYCVAYANDRSGKLVKRQMSFCGFEKDRESLKYRCPAAAYGFRCSEMKTCSAGRSFGRIVRVPLKKDYRHFVPVPRDSNKWDRLYAKRTAVERVNSRLDVSFGFEEHFVRGIKKMKLKSGLALVVMLAMALGSLKAGRKERIRSLVWNVKQPRAA